jgi:hypothetical protein
MKNTHTQAAAQIFILWYKGFMKIRVAIVRFGAIRQRLVWTQGSNRAWTQFHSEKHQLVGSDRMYYMEDS